MTEPVTWFCPPLEGPHPFRLDWTPDANTPPRSLLSVSKEGAVFVGPQLSAAEMMKLTCGPCNTNGNITQAIDVLLRSVLILSSEMSKVKKEAAGLREDVARLVFEKWGK